MNYLSVIRRLPHLAGFLILTLPMSRAFAEGLADASTQWGIGGVGSSSQRAYRGIDDDKHALPLLYVENKWVRLAGTGVDLKLPSAGPISFALRAAYSFDGYQPGDALILNGMEERKSSVWLGGSATWQNPYVDTSLEVLADGSGHSKGQRVTLSIDHDFRFGHMSLAPRIATTRLDSKYVNYYYGVRASEATSGRPQYEGQSTTNVETGLRAGYAFTSQQSVFIDVSTTRLGDKIRESPLVDRTYVSSARIGYLYKF